MYRLAGGAEAGEQALLAACLAAGGVASHRSAARLWRLRGVEHAPAEIIVPGGSTRLTGVVVHRTDTLDPTDVSRTERIPVTTPARTLLDLGAVAPVETVESALEDALMRRLVGFELLTSTLARLAGPGRSGSGVLRTLVEERDPATAPTGSVLEDLLLRVLRRGGLPEPVRQYEVTGGRLDGQRNTDKANTLLAHGWRVLRFTWFDLTRRPWSVVTAVARQLVLACPA